MDVAHEKTILQWIADHRDWSFSQGAPLNSDIELMALTDQGGPEALSVLLDIAKHQLSEDAYCYLGASHLEDILCDIESAHLDHLEPDDFKALGRLWPCVDLERIAPVARLAIRDELEKMSQE